MDNKRLFIVLPLVLALFLGWQLAIKKIREANNWADPNAVATDTTPVKPSVTPSASPTDNSGTPTTVPSIAGGSPGNPGAVGVRPVGTDKPVPASLGSAARNDPAYPLLLSINPQGAGLESVTLNDFWETAEQKALYVYQTATPGQEAITRPLATRWITINGQQLDISKINWELTDKTPGSVTYSARIDDVGKPLLTMTKTFTIHRRDSADGSKGFDVSVSNRFTDNSGKAITVHPTFNGPTTPARENQRSEDRAYLTGNDKGYQDVDNQRLAPGSLYGKHSMFSGGDKWTDTKDLVTMDTRPLLWLGACSSYFEALIVPSYAGKPGTPPVKIASAIATGIDAIIPDPKDPDAIDQPTTLAISTTDFALAPGQTTSFDFNVYFGPKWRQLLKDDPYYSAFPRCFETTLVTSGSYCGFLTFSWLINLLYGILWTFHWATRDWGLSIICLVICVRSLLHPITKRSQVQMLQMGKMGPEIERLKKKYGDDKDELNKAMMGVYKDQGIGPLLGCLPMFLQTPIWIALWSALQSTFELRQAGFLRWGWLPFHLSWIADLSQPDGLITFHTPLPLLFFKLHELNILPLLLAVVFFVNQALQPMPPSMTPEQAQQRKMMKWMSLLFPVMLYSGPSGLNLYILTSTTIGIIESKIIRDHIKQRDEAEKAGKVIVDAGKFGKKGRDDDKKKAAPSKPGRIAAFIAELQAKAAEVQREAQRRGKDRA